MVQPIVEIIGWGRKGVGESVRRAGLKVMKWENEEEVRELVGARGQEQPERRAYRWESERGYCLVMGQKAPAPLRRDGAAPRAAAAGPDS